MDSQMMGMCGAYCGACDWREKTNCPGCQAARGNMFWGTCAVATCAIEQGFPHCGLCPELPCATLQEYFNNPEHGDRGERLANLKGWARGEKTYLELRSLKQEDGPQ
jgi:hypothetical protein